MTGPKYNCNCISSSQHDFRIRKHRTCAYIRSGPDPMTPVLVVAIQCEGWEQENFLGKCSQSNSCQDGGCCCRLPTTCILPSTVILSPSATVPCPLWTSFEGRAHKGTKRLGDASRVSFVSASHSVIQLYGKLWLTRTTRSPFACLWNLLGGDSKLVKSTD